MTISLSLPGIEAKSLTNWNTKEGELNQINVYAR